MFDFEDDDITDSMSLEDFQRLEKEAWKKAEKNASENKKTNNVLYLDLTKDYGTTSNGATTSTRPCMTDLTKDYGTTSNGATTSTRPCMTSQATKEMRTDIHEYKRRVQELENKLCSKESELQVVRNNLDARRKELNEKNNMIAHLKKEQDEKRVERNCKLAQEVKTLKTKLSFQEHELNKLETQRLQSQKVPNSQNVCNNYQRVSSSQKGSQIMSQSVKRKADVSDASHGFDLENSFHDSQTSCYKVPQGKVPRLEGTRTPRKLSRSPEMKTSLSCKSKTDKIAKPRETTPSKEKTTSGSFCINNNEVREPKLVNMSERNTCNCIRKLVLSHSPDAVLNDESHEFETVSLLTLLKFPLKHLPDVLKAHSIDAVSPDLSLSQFPKWQTQVQVATSDCDEELDFDSGKYNLMSQGIFLLLNLSNLSEQNVDTLGVIHILVFLELYITSYLMTRQKIDEHDNKTESDPKNLRQETATAREDGTESGMQKVVYDDQDMILQTLQILKLLFYSTPGLVKCVLDRTSPVLFNKDTTDNDVIVIFDSDEAKPKEGENDNSTKEMSEDNAAVGSFRSLLLQNLRKLLFPLSDENSPLSVCHAALKVLIAMTTLCGNPHLERMFIPLNHGCLVELLAKDDCAMPTVSLVMSLISNFLPCQDVHSMVCSHTDDCILLKIYQCACEEEDYYGSEEMCREFLIQFFQFLTNVAASHNDSIEFLLESDCQCSFEIIRCLVLVLYDKVKYLLGFDIEHATSHESLPIVRTGINILVTLCTHACYSPDHKLHVEHEFSELIYECMNLFMNIRSCIPELEALALQDLLDMENIYEIEWSSGSDDEDDDDMVVS